MDSPCFHGIVSFLLIV